MRGVHEGFGSRVRGDLMHTTSCLPYVSLIMASLILLKVVCASLSRHRS